MTTTLTREPQQRTQPRTLTTADLAASANRPEPRTLEREESLKDADTIAGAGVTNQPEADLAPLFAEGVASDFRAHWNIVQQGFVDDPQNAVREGDELVAQVIKSLAETFASQRATLEGKQGSTEDLRLALRHYRSFYERLLSI
jgi:hypothetical protein